MEAFEYEVMAAVEGDHWWYSGMRAIATAWLDQITPRSDLQILDAGCGTGGNGAFLQRYGSVVGLDLVPLALTLAQQRLLDRLVRGSVLTLPFADASFDLVTSFDVLYHRQVIDEQVALEETRRVLRPGGRLLIRLPAYQWLSSQHDRSVHGRYRYTAGEARTLLQRSGFTIERVSYINSLLFPLAIAQRLADRVRSSTDGDHSEMEQPRPAINTALKTVLFAEGAWLKRGGSFPMGLSVLLLGRR